MWRYHHSSIEPASAEEEEEEKQQEQQQQSNTFKGLSFICGCVALDFLNRHCFEQKTQAKYRHFYNSAGNLHLLYVGLGLFSTLQYACVSLF